MAGQHSTGNPQAAWFRDPLNRHEYRYWDGWQWTPHVSDGGQTSVDPVGEPAAKVASRPWSRVPAFKEVARRGHTATLLADGTVLIAGGSDGYGDDVYTANALKSAVTYDPAAGRWADVGGMVSARKNHTATLLANGQVLVCGGLATGGLASAEVYDPASKTWIPTASMKMARQGDAVLLDDGRVLVSGGWEEVAVQDPPDVTQYVGLDAAEIFDPASGTWSDAEAMQQGRDGPRMVSLADGRVLAVGGEAGAESGVSFYRSVGRTSAEAYEPASDTWSSAGMMQSERAGYTITLLADGRVLVAGGRVDPSPTELFDPVSGIWSVTGAMTDIRRGHTATLLADSRVLVTGGWAAVAGVMQRTGSDSSEVYDPSMGTWSAVAPMHEKRAGHTATRLLDGRVLVVGGILRRDDPDGSGSRAAEVCDLLTDR